MKTSTIEINSEENTFIGTITHQAVDPIRQSYFPYKGEVTFNSKEYYQGYKELPIGPSMYIQLRVHDVNFTKQITVKKVTETIVTPIKSQQ